MMLLIEPVNQGISAFVISRKELALVPFFKDAAYG